MPLSYTELAEAHHRKSVRLRQHAYTQGTYFVTICTKGRGHLFGEIVVEKMMLNNYGNIADKTWFDLFGTHRHVELDAFIVMPNHVHGILHLSLGDLGRGVRSAIRPYAPTTNAHEKILKGPVAHSLGAYIRTYKSLVTQGIRSIHPEFERHIWQRNYHEHIIRNETELRQIRKYISDNPKKWEEDSENM